MLRGCSLPMSDPLPPVRGLVAAKYEVLGLIGRGGMGSVWEGRHQSLGTRVAIKFIDPEHAESDEARARFVTEARAAATIQSKHAIQIFDHGVTEDGRPYMVMELLVGEPLDKRLERLGSISLEETARVVGHVCRALQRAHDAGIIHRDLKPENIFLVRSEDDDDEIAKVLDFGIAKIKPPPGENGLTSSTKTGAVLGTPYYMSPEQARGLRNLDHRSDLWSLGVIAHKCVTGVLPFDGESVGDLLVKICTAPLPTPSTAVPELPASFDEWFFRALEREPPLRFDSASELAHALALAAGLPAQRGQPFSQSGRGALTSAARTPRGSQTELPGAAVTSAPLTTPTSPRRASRGALFAVLGAGLLAGSLGVAAVLKVVSPPKAEDTKMPAAVSANRLEAGAEPAPKVAAEAIEPAVTIAPSASTAAPRAVPKSAAPARTPSPPGATVSRPKATAAPADPGY
jgi:serine/threonine protein kinase